MFPALKQNLGNHILTGNHEAEIVVIQWLIAKDTVAETV